MLASNSTAFGPSRRSKRGFHLSPRTGTGAFSSLGRQCRSGSGTERHRGKYGIEMLHTPLTNVYRESIQFGLWPLYFTSVVPYLRGPLRSKGCPYDQAPYLSCLPCGLVLPLVLIVYWYTHSFDTFFSLFSFPLSPFGQVVYGYHEIRLPLDPPAHTLHMSTMLSSQSPVITNTSCATFILDQLSTRLNPHLSAQTFLSSSTSLRPSHARDLLTYLQQLLLSTLILCPRMKSLRSTATRIILAGTSLLRLTARQPRRRLGTFLG